MNGQGIHLLHNKLGSVRKPALSRKRRTLSLPVSSRLGQSLTVTNMALHSKLYCKPNIIKQVSLQNNSHASFWCKTTSKALELINCCQSTMVLVEGKSKPICHYSRHYYLWKERCDMLGKKIAPWSKGAKFPKLKHVAVNMWFTEGQVKKIPRGVNLQATGSPGGKQVHGYKESFACIATTSELTIKTTCLQTTTIHAM